MYCFPQVIAKLWSTYYVQLLYIILMCIKSEQVYHF